MDIILPAHIGLGNEFVKAGKEKGFKVIDYNAPYHEGKEHFLNIKLIIKWIWLSLFELHISSQQYHTISLLQRYIMTKWRTDTLKQLTNENSM